MTPETADFMNAQARALRDDPLVIERRIGAEMAAMFCPPAARAVERNVADLARLFPCPERAKRSDDALAALGYPMFVAEVK